MNATQLLTLQIASLVTILFSAEGLFTNRGATLILQPPCLFLPVAVYTLVKTVNAYLGN